MQLFNIVNILLILSAAAKRSVLKYRPKESGISFETQDFPVIITDKNNKDVKRVRRVKKWDGSKETIQQAIRDTYVPFKKVATECGWSEEEKIEEFQSNVLEGEGKIKFEEALEEDDIDPENPDPDDGDLALANLLDIAAEARRLMMFTSTYATSLMNML